MSVSVIYLREGYTAEQKRILIDATKRACMEGLELSREHSYVFIQEIASENMDETCTNMHLLFVYTTCGKTTEGKNLVCKGFENACHAAFGGGRSIVIFKEHADDNAGSDGFLRPFVKEISEVEKRNT